ncbi:hypothetical protein NMY22_g2025 [Coprinellus aureogranulatus]|nr:hypothetical protein NMY22_g2025 [Coprinellus aureogranulatus]
MCVDVGRRRPSPDCVGADRFPLPLSFVRSSYAVVPLPGRTPRIRLFWVRGCKTSSQDPDRHGPSDPTCTTTDNDPRGELPNATVRDGRLEVCISGLDIVGYAIQLGSNPYGGRNGCPESLQSSRNSMGSREVMGQKFRSSTQDALQLKSPSRLVPEPESVVSQGSMQRALCTGLPVALPGRPPQSSGRVMALIPAPPAKARPYLACFQVNLGEGALSTYLRHSGRSWMILAATEGPIQSPIDVSTEILLLMKEGASARDLHLHACFLRDCDCELRTRSVKSVGFGMGMKFRNSTLPCSRMVLYNPKRSSDPRIASITDAGKNDEGEYTYLRIISQIHGLLGRRTGGHRILSGDLIPVSFALAGHQTHQARDRKEGKGEEFQEFMVIVYMHLKTIVPNFSLLSLYDSLSLVQVALLRIGARVYYRDG